MKSGTRFQGDSPPRIAIVAPSLDILGGQGIQARDLADALQDDGFEVLFLPVNPRFPRGLRWLRRIPMVRTAVNQLFYGISLLRLRRVDVVHVFSASYWSFLLAPVPAVLAARAFGKRVILNYHSGEADDHLSRWGMRVHPFLRRVDEIVVPSVYLQRVFASHGYTARVLRNIIDLSSFRFRERMPVTPRLLSCRNLESHYRVRDVLEAFALLRQTVPEATLEVAGYGSEATRLRRWVAERGLPGVTFLGRVEPEAIPALYDRADIFLNASVIDNQPISILEAFAAGTAVVSTPTGDIPWMLDEGRLGALVPPESPRALAEAVEALLASPEHTAAMTRKARAAVQDFTWAGVRAGWMEAYGVEAPLDREAQASTKHAEKTSNNTSVEDRLEGKGGPNETPAAV
jgi:glycosyltransferase involved in cell wall biosynthesis